MIQAQSSPAKIATIQDVLKTYFASPATLHGAAAHSSARVKKFIADKGIKELINKPESPYRLTAVHVAVLKGDWKTVHILVKAGGSLLAKDYLGNTPAHLAATLGNWPMVEKLKALGQDFSQLRNTHLGTVDDLRKITLPPATKPSDVVVLFKNGQGEIVPMTQEAYQKRTSTLYCDYPQATSHQLTKDWCEKSRPGDSPDAFGMWTSYCKNKPRVYLEEQLLPESNTPVGLGVRAGEDILPKTLLFPWGGEWLADPTIEGSNLRVDEIDSLINSNMACRVNDGFPNVFAMPLRVEGLPCGLGVVAFEKLSKDAIVTINYGVHGCKFGRYGFFYKKEMEDYCQGTDFKKEWVQAALFQRKRQAQAELFFCVAELIQIAEIGAKGIYLLETPRAIVHLAALRLLTAEGLANLIKMVGFFRNPPERQNEAFLAEFSADFMEFLKGLETTEPDYKKVLLEHLNQLFTQHNVISGMMIFNHWRLHCSFEIFKTNHAEFIKKLEVMHRVAIALDVVVDSAPDLLIEEKKQRAADEICAIQKMLPILTDIMLGNAVALRHNQPIALALVNVLKDNHNP